MSDWNLTLTGGPRDGDRITTSDSVPFLKFTTGSEDGTTTDHYYGPTSVNRDALTAVYEPLDGPESALAQVWEQGYEAGKYDGTAPRRQHENPYRRTA